MKYLTFKKNEVPEVSWAKHCAVSIANYQGWKHPTRCRQVILASCTLGPGLSTSCHESMITEPTNFCNYVSSHLALIVSFATETLNPDK